MTEHHFGDVGQTLVDEFIVTRESTIEIHSNERKKECFGVIVDVCGDVAGYPIIVYLTHPGRNVPVGIQTLDDQGYGVLLISLNATYSLFMDREGHAGPYLDRLRLLWETDLESKRWIAHPRYRRSRKRSEERLEAREEELLLRREMELSGPSRSDTNLRAYDIGDALAEVEHRSVKYQCVMCHRTWVGLDPGGSPCPNCDTHLYRRLIEYLGSNT